MFHKKTFLVTGSAGFIGSHMVDYLLKKKHFVIGIDNLKNGSLENIKHNFKNNNFLFLKKDLLKDKINLKKNVDFIIHFAGISDVIPSIEKPLFYIEQNVIGTAKLLEWARGMKVKKFVYAASSSCYGLNDKKISENEKISIEHPYALSKFLGENVALSYGKIYNIKVNSIRIFNAYGPRVRSNSNYGAVFGVFFKQKISGKPLTVIGSGNQKRDYVYVTDVCSAFYKCVLSEYENEIFNLGTGNPQKINTLVKILNTKKITIPWRPGEPRVTWANINKIKKYLNWSPKISFEQGVKIMLKNISYWKLAPLWTKSNINKATQNWFTIFNERN
jgi:UDP-glucose 4-epimerase